MKLNENMNVLKLNAKEKIQKLVEKYEEIIANGKKDRYNEERVKISFILPFDLNCLTNFEHFQI